MAIAPLAFSQLATTGVTADPRAELERLRKLKRLKELEAKASGAAPQPAPAQPVAAGPVNQTDATNPIVAAQRASQTQAGNAFAAQKAEEQRRIQERREASRAYGAGMDMIVTTDDQGQLQPGTNVDRDISKGVIGSPIQFGQGLAEGTANFINNATNIGAEGLNAANKLLLGDKAFKFTGTDIQVPQNVIVDQGGPLQSVSGMAPRIAGQIMSTRVPLGKVMPGGGVGAEIAKDAVSYAAATDKDTQRVSDMLPAGTPLDFLRSREGESYAEAFAKNALEDAGLSAAATALLKGGVKVLDSVGNQPMTPTNAGGANLGSPRPMPAQTPANALASPPAPAQAASAAQPSVVPQPTVSQAGTAGTGQQAGAGVGAGGGGAVPPAGPATLQATPRRVPAAVDPEKLADDRAAIISVSRFMRSARIPSNVVDDYVGSLLSRYEPLKSERYPLAFFVEEDLPQYLESRGYSPDKARNLAGDVAVKTTGYGKAANSFTGSGNSSRYTMQDTIHQLTSTQKSELEGTFKAVLGDETLMGRSDEIGALMRENGQVAYNNSISEANRLLKTGKASPEQVKAAQEINAILTNAGFKEFYPESLTIEATTRGRTVDELIQERLAADPIDTAHWLQSEIGQAARDAKNIDGSQTNMSRAYETMRKAILDRLEKFDGYKGARMQHGDLFGADEAISFGDRFLTAARSEFKTDQMARELAKLSPRQQQVAALSIRDALLNQIIRLSPEEAPARITQLQNEGTLKALVTVLGEERGTELRNAIANMRVENQRIAGVSQANGSPTHLLQQGAKDAVDNLRGPANRLVHGAGNPTGWGVAGIASMAMGNPLPLVAKGAASIVDKLSTPTAKFQSRATRGLYGLPNVADDAAGAVPPNANALASPPPSGGPTPFGGAGGGNTTGNALSRPPPRTRAQRPPPTVDEWAQRIETDQNELQRLLKQYDQIDRADPNVDDLMRANLAKQKNARRRIAEKTKKMEAARAAQPEPEPAVPNAPQIAPANAFNAEPQAAAQAAPSGNAFNGKRALPGETSNASPAVTGALVSGGLTGGATYAATGDEDLALRAGGLAAIGGAVAGNRLAKFGSGRQPPKPPVPKAPVAFKRDPALANLSPGDMVAYIEAKYPRAGNSISSPSPYWDAATAIKRANGDRAAAAAELQRYADYLKSPEAKATAEQIKTAERTVRAVADVDPIFFDDAAFTASMKGKAEAGGNSAMEQIRGATADNGIGGAMDVANRADDMLPGERPIAPRGKPAPKPPTRQGFGSSKLPMDEGARMARAREQGFDVDTPLYHGTAADFDSFDPKKLGANDSLAPDAREAFFFSTNPRIASQYAEEAGGVVARRKAYNTPDGRKQLESPTSSGARRVGDMVDAETPNGQNVVPVYARLKNPLIIDDMPEYDGGRMRTILSWAKVNGHDGVIFKGLSDALRKGAGTADTYAIFKPENIRGKFAKFDPAESSSSKLLAGLGGPSGAGAAGGGILGYTLNPADANGDGVIDDLDRGLNGFGAMVSGGIAGKALGSRAAGKFGNRMKGPPKFRAPDAQTFGGVNAKTADRAALGRAQNMEAEGADRNAIWDATGWFKGVDGKWRFEIDDSGAQLTGKPQMPDGEMYDAASREMFGVSYGRLPFGPTDANGYSTLGPQREAIIARVKSQIDPRANVLDGQLDHPNLYQAYPDARDTEISLGNKRGPAGASWDGQRISTDSGDDISAVLHENQHATQQREGFARGGNPEMPELRDAALRERDAAFSTAKSRYDALFQERRMWEDEWVGKNKLRDHQLRWKMASEEWRRQFPEKAKEMDSASNDMQGVPPDYHGAYKRLAGETEARNVQTRRDFTPEERRARRPWETQDVPDDQQIVRFASGKAESRPKPPPNRLASGPPRPKREGPSTASRMVAGGVIGGIAGSAGSADPQTAETAQKIADNKAQLEGALSQIAEFEDALKIFSNGTNEEIQRQLDKEGFDLGPTGIDGDIGKNTAAAIRARKAELGKNLEVARTRLKELEGFASELEQQAAFERTRPTDEQQTFRDYAPLLGGIAGALGAKTIRIGGTTASKFTARNAIKKADALLNNTPISTPRNKQERAAIDARATNVNEFFKRGGANKPENMKQRLGMEPRKSVPFESKRDGTMTARPLSKVTAPADLFPDKFFGGRLGPVDALIGGSAATEAVLAGQNAEMVKEKLVAAYETAKGDPSEKNLARIQELEDQYAQAKGLMMLGIGAGIGTGIGVMTSKYASRRANVPMAEQELAILRQYFASRKKPAPKAPPAPKNALASPPLPPARPRRTP